MNKVIEINGMKYELTEDKIRRINEAIAETQVHIDREMKYSEDFRKHENIARWQAHIAKLEAMKA
jgi:ribosomal protein S13